MDFKVFFLLVYSIVFLSSIFILPRGFIKKYTLASLFVVTFIALTIMVPFILLNFPFVVHTEKGNNEDPI